MRKYLVQLGIWLIDMFGTFQGPTYTVRYGRLKVPFHIPCERKKRALAAWHRVEVQKASAKYAETLNEYEKWSH